MTHGRAEIHELLLAHDLHPSRALGQNFVADANTVRRIVRLAGVTPGRRVVEIGAGLGSLTLALAEAGASVTAVEIDRHVLPVLRAQVEPLGVRVVEADALTIDWAALLDGDGGDGGDVSGGRGDLGGLGVDDAAGSGSGRSEDAGAPGPAREDPAPGDWSLVANLPYNVAVPLVIRVLEEAPQISSLLVMVQREVGERLAARAGQEAYGAVSVKVAYWATAAVVGRVSASVFIPRPRVESVLVRLDRRRCGEPGSDGSPAGLPAGLADGLPVGHAAGLPAGPGTPAYDRLFAVVRGGFAHRRKMLRRSLEDLVDPEAYAATGIRPTARAEELALDEWERLAAWQPGAQGSGVGPRNHRHPGPADTVDR